MSSVEEVANYIGKIITNLQSLEFMLRVFLFQTQASPEDKKKYPESFIKMEAGDIFEENSLTNYDALKDLIKKVNLELSSRGIPDHIDNSLVLLRDAIAHGRVLALNPEGPYHIIKFSRPYEGNVTVDFSEDLTEKWLLEQVKLVSDELHKIMQICQSLGFIS